MRAHTHIYTELTPLSPRNYVDSSRDISKLPKSKQLLLVNFKKFDAQYLKPLPKF